MTQDEIIEMARQSGMFYREFENEFANANTDGVDLKTIEAFAELVRNHYSYTHAHLWLIRIEGAVQAEREACALIADNMDALQDGAIGKAIRARGEA